MKKIIATLGVTVLLAGCASKNFEIFDNKKEEGTIHGFLTGAATGAIVGSPTLVGAGVGALVGGTVGLCAGDIADKNDPRYYTEKNSNSTTVNIIGKPFKMNNDEDMWYVIYDKNGQPAIAKKPLKDKIWIQVK